MGRLKLSSYAVFMGVSACSADPVTTADVRRYTGLSLCSSASVRDLTSNQERDTTPGYYFHVRIALDPTCDSSFRNQLAGLPKSGCTTAASLNQGCYVEDAYPKAAKHTSIMVSEVGRRTYDMRFYQ